MTNVTANHGSEKEKLLSYAKAYRRRGWEPTPILSGSKAPKLSGWQNLRLTEADLVTHFAADDNIGLVLGQPSHDLVDVDLDCEFARVLAAKFLPRTLLTSGRQSAPGSHYWYQAELSTTQFVDPSCLDKKEAMILELRSTGAQTLVAPSRHPSGEIYTWHSKEQPATVPAAELEQAARKLAACALLCRYWTEGKRHLLALAFSGVTLRANWLAKEVSNVLDCIVEATGDEERADRLEAVFTTGTRLATDRKASGLPTLKSLLPEAVVSKLIEWLALDSYPNFTSGTNSTRETAAAPEPAASGISPLALPDEMLPVPALPASLLPEALGPWVADIAARMQCPLEFPAVASLVALASVVGNRFRIKPKCFDDWTVTPNLWGSIVARPGYLKTPALQEALLPLRQLEHSARTKHEARKLTFEFDSMVAEARKKELEAKIRAAVKEGEDPDEFQSELVNTIADPPIEQRYIVNDSTVEKLGEILNQNPRGVLLLRDELVGWFKSLERDGHESDRAFYLEAWNGSGSFVCDRISRGTTRIDNLTLSVLGGIQPGPLRGYLHAALAEGTSDDGLMQRFQLLVYPDTSSEWKNVDRVPDAQAAERARNCFSSLDAQAAEIAQFQCLRFDGPAQRFFDEWRQDLELTLRDGSLEHAALEGHLSKFRSLMPTLALLFELCAGNGVSVSLQSARMAAGWCSFLEAHARRVYGLALTSEIRQAKSIVRKIQSGQLPGKFTARDLYRKCWAGLSASEVRDPLRVLVDHNYLSVLKPETGGRITEIYLAHPSLLEASA